MGGLKMVKGKVVKNESKEVKGKVAIKVGVSGKKIVHAEPEYDGPVISKTKGVKGEKPVVEKITKEKQPKETKERVMTRTCRMGHLIATREYTDAEMYEILDAEFGPGKKYLATYRHNMNVRELEKDPKFEQYTRMIRGQDGSIGQFIAQEKSQKKEKRVETKAKITLAVSKLPVK